MQIQVFYFLLVLAVWLLGVSIVLWRIFALFNKLTKGVGVADLKKVLEKVISDESQNEEEIQKLARRISYLEEDGKLHVQKVGLVRFNPFKELGGDHSFTLAILDGQDSGVIITGLHARDRTRVYMKTIKKGEGEFELSSEEKRALSIAQKKK